MKKNKIKQPGKFIISLDFELLYGMNDVTKKLRWVRNTTGAREVIPKMLSEFKKYNMHVTWGIVGMLYAKNKEEWMENRPFRIPNYEEERFSTYTCQTSLLENEKKDPLHFAPSLIQAIEKTPSQEIASHTYSHYYCMEKGQSREDFRADLIACQKVAEKRKEEIHSLIFPKNQFERSFLNVVEEQGIFAVRGNESGFLYEASAAGESLFKRGIRLLDSYLNLSGFHTYVPEQLEIINHVVNIPSSRLLRPYSQRFSCFEGLKLRRIKGQMLHAAKRGEIFHLWWHPHNFGSNQEKNLENLRILLEYYQKLNKKYGIQSMTMEEAAKDILSIV